MYRIIGQPINFRYIGTSEIVEPELSEKAREIVKICEFGLNKQYNTFLKAY